MPYSACYDTSAKIRQQFSWKKETQDLVWMWITKQKIGNQALVLEKKQATDAQNLLLGYARDVQPGDGTNREGLAAKSYFTALFGVDFDRRRDSDIRNTYLNYGYSLILSCVNKEIASFGYLTSIGIHHIGETNPFNLGCDFMEPIRPFVDRMIITNAVDEVNYKTQFMALLTSEVLCGGKNMIMENAIRSYVMGVLAALNEENLEGIQEITFKNEQL
jgi:CRISPR-associated endonuclease Cas1 subtype II